MTNAINVSAVKQFAAEYDEFAAKRAEGFSADETKSEDLSVSYDSGGSSGSSGSSDYGNYYISGSTVYVYGSANSQISLFNGGYGTAVNIDATGSSGDNLLSGNSAANIILGGSYSNMLWGSLDYANDVLVGGTGYNFFVSGKSEGSDAILNAGLSDRVYLHDVTIADVAFAASDGYTLGIMFNTGNVLTINGTSSASADIQLADDSVWWYSYGSKTWHQTA